MPEPGLIEFVVCYFRDDQPGRLLDFLGSVGDIGIKFEAYMDIASGAYVCLWFRPGTPSERLKLVDELKSKLGDDLKLIHGSEQGSWGVFTCSKLAHYGFAIPGFDSVLGQLALLSFGEAKLFKR